MNYDPDWTIEEAIEATVKASCDGTEPESPVGLWMAHHDLALMGYFFEVEGNMRALMWAIKICAEHAMPLPPWAANAYITAYDRINDAYSKTWDDVFGAPYPKGTNLNALRKRKSLRPKVYAEVQMIRQIEPGASIDDALFERVGEKLGISGKLASNFYYQHKKLRSVFPSINF